MTTRTELGIGADVLAGTCVIAIGIGLARFDFSILAKQMATAGWIDTASIGDLSGGNLIGYLIGCFHQSRLRRHQHVLAVMALALVMTVVSMLAEGFWSSAGSQAVWRFVGGWAAAQLMTGAPSLALRRVPARQLRLSTAIVMGGAGLGGLLVVCLPRAWATRHCLVGVALAGVAAAALFAWGESQALVVLGSFLLGCWTWMIVSLTHLRIHDFVPSQAHRRSWATCTLLYGLGLMLVSFASSGLASSNLQLVLVICLGLILLHAVLELLQCRAAALPDQGLPLRTAGDR